MAKSDYVGTGGILYLNTLVVSLGNWLFWIIITQFTSASIVGQAVVVISLSLLVVTINQLGLEYTLVKKSSKAKDYFSNSILLEFIISLISIPIVISVINHVYDEPVQELTYLVIGIILLSSFTFVSRFSILGISEVKTIVVVDLVGMVIRLVTGFTFILIDPSPVGIIVAFVAQILATSIFYTLVSVKKFGFKPLRLTKFKELITDGLVNAPSRLSRIIIFNLSVVFSCFFLEFQTQPSEFIIFP